MDVWYNSIRYDGKSCAGVTMSWVWLNKSEIFGVQVNEILITLTLEQVCEIRMILQQKKHWFYV